MKHLRLLAGLIPVVCFAQIIPPTVGPDPVQAVLVSQRNELANNVMNAQVENKLLKDKVATLEVENAALKKELESLKPKPVVEHKKEETKK